jgi:hypothetical protein
MKKKGAIIGAVIILFIGGCNLFQELLEPSDITKILDDKPKDISSPVITINSPSNGTEVGLLYQISGTVLDDSSGVRKVSVFNDGTPVPVTLTGDTWTANISNAIYGIHTNTVTAEDNSGNVCDPKSVWVNRVNTPSIIISSPANGSLVTNPNVPLSGTTIIDLPNVVTLVEVQLNSGSWNPATGTDLWTNNLLLIEGTNTIYARAIADNGKTNTSTVWKVIKATYPSIGISLPANNSSTNIPTISISGTSSVPGPYHVTSVQVKTNGGTWNSATGTTNWSIPQPLVEGTNFFFARAITDSGKTNGTLSQWKIVKYTLPLVSIISPANHSQTNSPNIVLYGTASVPAPYAISLVQVRLNGGIWSNASGTASWSNELLLISGTNYISARAITDNGKTNTGAPIEIVCTSGYYWTRKIGGTGEDYAYDIANDGFGNIYVTGQFRNSINFSADWGESDIKSSVGGGGSDIFITKISNSGAYIWTKQIGGTSFDEGLSIVCDVSGNIYITGYFRETVNFMSDWSGTDSKTNAGLNDIFITKINANGTYGWTYRIGGSGNDYGKALAADSSGNVYLTGYFDSGTVNFAGDWSGIDNKSCSGSFDTFVTKISNTGAYCWTKRFGDTGDDEPCSITTDVNGNVFLSGYFNDTVNFGADWSSNDNKASAGNRDGFITKISGTGAYCWTKRIGESGFDTAYSLTADVYGNIFVTGDFVGYPLNFAADWSSSDNLYSIAGIADIFITKIKADGTYDWTQRMGGLSTDYGNAITTDGSGNVYLTGYFISGTADFGADWSSNIIKTNAGDSDIYITKINANGSYGWTKWIGGPGSDKGLSLTIDGNGGLYIAGFFQSTVNFCADWSGTDSKTNAGLSDIFISKVKGW